MDNIKGVQNTGYTQNAEIITQAQVKAEKTILFFPANKLKNNQKH